MRNTDPAPGVLDTFISPPHQVRQHLGDVRAQARTGCSVAGAIAPPKGSKICAAPRKRDGPVSSMPMWAISRAYRTAEGHLPLQVN